MAKLFGHKRANNTTSPPAASLRVSTALQGKPRPFGYGQNRVSTNMIDYQGFKAFQVASSSTSGGGKGGGGTKSSASYTWNYSASVILSVGEAVAGYYTVFDNNAVDFLVSPPAPVLAAVQSLGIVPTYGNTYGFGFYYGSSSQTADGGWAANYPAHSLAYRGESYVIAVNLALGSSPNVPNFSLEVLWPICNDIPALGLDANPADAIQDFLTNATYGVPGFASSLIGDFATAKNYWRATGLMISPLLNSGVAANSWLKDLMDALNADFSWSSGKLNIVPYGDQNVVGNGYNYTPNLTPVYQLGIDDLLPNQGSLGQGASADKFVSVERMSANDVFNNVRIEYLDRNFLYNPVTLYHTDDANIAFTGRMKISDLKQNHFFCLASAASTSVALQLHRQSAEMVTYQFTCSRALILCDALDLLTLTYAPFQLNNQLMRIVEIQENDDETLTFTCVEVPGTAHAPVYLRQPPQGSARNNNAPASACNTPFFFEPPDQIAGNLVIAVGLSGQTPSLWGGCEVYWSSDNVNFTYAGTFTGFTRMGVTTGSITSVTPSSTGTTTDTTNTLSVNLSSSGGSLGSGSNADMLAFNTAVVVDNEILSYQTATLTGPNAYNLTTLGRGGFGTTIASHNSGAQFMRYDTQHFSINYDGSRIGKPIYFKFLGFNQNGGGLQSLASVTSYAYTPTGAALSSPLPNVTGLYTNFEAGFQKIYWDPVSDYRNPVYEIRRGTTWASGQVLAVQAHPPFIARGNGTFWIAARATPQQGVTTYSATPVSIVIAGNQLIANSVKTYDEQANTFPGTKDTGLVVSGSGVGSLLYLPGSSYLNVVKYYTESGFTDLLYVANAAVNATIAIAGVPEGSNVLSIADFLNTPDILGLASTAYVAGWVEINTSVANSGTPTWLGWQKFVPGVYQARHIQFRLALENFDPKTDVTCTAFNWTIAAPARVDHYYNQSIAAGGTTITFQPDGAAVTGAFNAGPNGATLPFVSVSWQATAGDVYQLTALSLTSLTIKILNGGVGVARTGVNVIVEGY